MSQLNKWIGVIALLLVLNTALTTVGYAQTAQPTQPAAQSTPTPTQTSGGSNNQGQPNNTPLGALIQLFLSTALSIIGPILDQFASWLFGGAQGTASGLVSQGNNYAFTTNPLVSTQDPTVENLYNTNAFNAGIILTGLAIMAIFGKAIGPLVDHTLPFSIEEISREILNSVFLVAVFLYTGLEDIAWLIDRGNDLSSISGINPTIYQVSLGQTPTTPQLVVGFFESGALAIVYLLMQARLIALDWLTEIGPIFMLFWLVPFVPLVFAFGKWWFGLLILLIASQPVLVNILGFGASWLQGKSFANDPLTFLAFLLVIVIIAVKVTLGFMTMMFGVLQGDLMGSVTSNASGATRDMLYRNIARRVPARVAAMFARTI